MKLKPAIRLTLTALAAAAVAAPALGAGEPKNQLPFDRHTTVQPGAVRVISGVSGIVAVGEAKNEAPFTARFSADPGYAKAMREAAGAMPLRTLQFLALGDGGAPGVVGRSVTGVKSHASVPASPNHHQVERDAL
jgi:hypothetical protein